MSIDGGLSDEDLVRQFRAGDGSAFHALFLRYQRPIYNYVYRVTGRLAASEDLTQDVFLRAFSSLGRGADVANCRAWLYRVATNAAISHLRKQEHHNLSLDSVLAECGVPEPVSEAGADPALVELRREEIRRAASALRQLSATHRQVLVLRQLQGLSYQEIAEVMGLTGDAVTSLLHRARLDFRAALAQLDRDALGGAEKGGAS